MVRILAWALFAATAALVAVGAILMVVGQQRGFETTGTSWTSQFLIIGIGGTAAVLTAAVGVVIAVNARRNAIAWIFLTWACLLAAIMAGYGYADWTIVGWKQWPGSAFAAAFVGWSFIPAVFVAPALVAQLFPGGRTRGGRWRDRAPRPHVVLLRADEPAGSARRTREPHGVAGQPRERPRDSRRCRDAAPRGRALGALLRPAGGRRRDRTAGARLAVAQGLSRLRS